MPVLLHSALLVIIDESEDIISDFEAILENLIDKVIKISRNADEIKGYQVQYKFYYKSRKLLYQPLVLRKLYKK